MRWLAKTFTGLLLAATLLAIGGYFGANYLITQFTKLPPKPTFANDDPNFAKKNAQKAAAAKSNAEKAKGGDKPAEKEPEKKPLPPGAFEGKVTFEKGLILRDSPSRDANSIGGVDLNEKVTVLESSAEGDWQKIRTSADKEGWIRGGYVQKN